MVNNPELPDPEKIYSSEEFVAAATDHFELTYERKVTPVERRILQTNRELAKALFAEDGISQFILDGSTTIGELNLKPRELLDILRDPAMKIAIANGAVSVHQLGQLPVERLASIKGLLATGAGDGQALASLLNLHGEEADRFADLLRPAAQLSGSSDSLEGDAYAARHPASAANLGILPSPPAPTPGPGEGVKSYGILGAPRQR